MQASEIERVYRENFEQLERYARRLMRNQDYAEDAMSEMIGRACEDPTRCRSREDAGVRSYLFGILKRVCCEMIEAMQAEKEAMQAMSAEADAADPDAEFLRQIALLNIHARLQVLKLPKRHVEMFFDSILGHSRESLSERYGMSENGVKITLQRVRRQIRECQLPSDSIISKRAAFWFWLGSRVTNYRRPTRMGSKVGREKLQLLH